VMGGLNTAERQQPQGRFPVSDSATKGPQAGEERGATNGKGTPTNRHGLEAPNRRPVSTLWVGEFGPVGTRGDRPPNRGRRGGGDIQLFLPNGRVSRSTRRPPVVGGENNDTPHATPHFRGRSRKAARSHPAAHAAFCFHPLCRHIGRGTIPRSQATDPTGQAESGWSLCAQKPQSGTRVPRCCTGCQVFTWGRTVCDNQAEHPPNRPRRHFSEPQTVGAGRAVRSVPGHIRRFHHPTILGQAGRRSPAARADEGSVGGHGARSGGPSTRWKTKRLPPGTARHMPPMRSGPVAEAFKAP